MSEKQVMSNRDGASARGAASDGAAGTSRSTYLQVQDLVDRLRNSHRRLHTTYAQLADEANGKGGRTEMILQYLQRREREVGDFLDRFSKSQREGVLKTWVQYADFGSYESQVEELLSALPREPRVLRARVAELDQELYGHYDRLAAQARSQMVKQFFHELSQTTQQRAKENTEMLQQVEDL